MKSFILALSTLAVAMAAPATPYRPAPYHAPTPAYHAAPAPYKETPAHYQYGYAVQDDYAGVNFGANEARDGYATNGEYHVALPDGRIQTVTYHVADDYSGYVADVKYSGEPRYAPKPHPAPAPYHPKPAPYRPAPAPYHPAPAPYRPAPYHPTPAPYHG